MSKTANNIIGAICCFCIGTILGVTLGATLMQLGVW